MLSVDMLLGAAEFLWLDYYGLPIYGILLITLLTGVTVMTIYEKARSHGSFTWGVRAPVGSDDNGT